MEPTPQVLMLYKLSFEYYGPREWWKSYGFFLKSKDDKVYFSSSSAKVSKEETWSFSEVEVPNSVLEDLSEMARAGGAVGTPEWVDPLSQALDAHTYHYDLYWTDGTHTGPGTAANHIMNYLRELARQCAGIALPGEPLPKNTAKEIAMLSQEKTSTQASTATTQGMWTCPACDSTVSGKKFCEECGQPKPK